MKRSRFTLYLTVSLGLLLCPQALRADDDVRARIDAAGDAEKWNSDIVVVLDHKDVVVQPNGLGVATEHNVTKVLRDGGIRGQSVKKFLFDPYTNRLELVAVRVLPGRWRHRGNPGRTIRSFSHNRPTASSGRPSSS